MATQVSYPGVYIEEFAPGAPIEGVGTSTAAFLGPTKAGSPNEPTKITSWDAFSQTFGDSPVENFYLWYAVRGFFENGGTVCYITRVSNADFDRFVFRDLSGGAGELTIVVRAREFGGSDPPIRVAIDDDIHAVRGTGPSPGRVFRPTASISSASGTSITVTDEDDAIQFRPGDTVTWAGSTETQPVVVSRVEGTTIRTANALGASYGPFPAANRPQLRLMDLKPGGSTFRAENAAGLSAGSVISLDQAASGASPAVSDPGLIVKRVDVERITPALTTYRVELRQPLTKTFAMTRAISLESQEFRITVTQDGSTTVYDELGMDPEHRNYFARVVRADAGGVIFAEPVEPPNTTPPPKNRPKTKAATLLAGGQNENTATLAASEYKRALALLEAVDDVNMIAIPDRTDLDVQLAMIAHCEKKKDRFAILDSRRGARPFGTDSVEVHRQGVDTVSGHAALYYPWLLVPPAGAGDLVLIPPSGHVAGIYARLDTRRGVHKAPAGSEALVRDALGVERTLSDADQGQLNPGGINVIRVFAPGGTPVVWGARTTVGEDRNWQYVNVRRLLLFIEESIEEGIRWAVFEPNNLELWQKLKRTISDFLSRVWRDGALFGATKDEAFFVRIDKVLNPFSEQQLGRLNIEIGVRPSYPAEFIVVRIGISPGGSEITET